MTASAMDCASVDALDRLGVPFIKIGSGDSNNVLLLEKASKLVNRPLVISTGMSDLDQVKAIYAIMKKAREYSNNNFVLLQCTSSYPTKLEGKQYRHVRHYPLAKASEINHNLLVCVYCTHSMIKKSKYFLCFSSSIVRFTIMYPLP